MKFILPYAVALVTLVALDGIWLGLISGKFVQAEIGHLFGDKIIWWAVALFYLIYAAAVIYFASAPASSASGAFVRGAILGFVVYMTYDLTNLATLRDWPVLFVLVDIAWGTGMTAVTAFVVSFAL